MPRFTPLLLAALLLAATGCSTPGANQSPKGTIVWSACPSERQPELECGEVLAPMTRTPDDTRTVKLSVAQIGRAHV